MSTPAEVFSAAGTVVVMLYDESAVDAVLERGGPGFASMVRDRTVVVMGTQLTGLLRRPRSRSGRRRCELRGGSGVGIARPGGDRTSWSPCWPADDPEVLAGVRSSIEPMIAHAVVCGPVPAALTTKIAVNAYMITMVTGLVEAVHLADRSGLDRRVLAEALLGGPLVSPLLRGKLDKLLADDYGAQAAVADVAKNTGLITATARSAGAATPLAVVCDELFGEAVALGHGVRRPDRGPRGPWSRA